MLERRSTRHAGQRQAQAVLGTQNTWGIHLREQRKRLQYGCHVLGEEVAPLDIGQQRIP
jgi:hypothetical protein